MSESIPEQGESVPGQSTEDELRAKIVQLEAEKRVITTAVLELIGAIETLANHAARVLNSLRNGQN